MNNENNSPNTTTLENFQNLGINILNTDQTTQIQGGAQVLDDLINLMDVLSASVETTSTDNTIALDLGTVDLF